MFSCIVIFICLPKIIVKTDKVNIKINYYTNLYSVQYYHDLSKVKKKLIIQIRSSDLKLFVDWYLGFSQLRVCGQIIEMVWSNQKMLKFLNFSQSKWKSKLWPWWLSPLILSLLLKFFFIFVAQIFFKHKFEK